MTGLVALLWLLGCATTYASLGHLTSLDNESAAPIAANAADFRLFAGADALSLAELRAAEAEIGQALLGTRRARPSGTSTRSTPTARMRARAASSTSRAAAPGDPAAARARAALGGLGSPRSRRVVAALVAPARGAPSHDRPRAARTRVRLRGEGGFGVVWEVASRAEPGRRFALKVIEVDDVATANAGVLEATRLAECRHPNLLAAREQFFHNRWGEAHWLARLCVAPWELCIVMELCAEGSLWELLDRLWDADESLPERVILQVGAQLAHGG